MTSFRDQIAALLKALRPIEKSAAWARDYAERSPSAHQEFIREADDNWRAYEQAKASVLVILDAAPPPQATNGLGDPCCEHGTAMDVHCCNCHSGFIFDANHECPEPPSPQAFDYVKTLRAAQAFVKASPLYKRFIDGTPLSNDIAVWMTDFAKSALPVPALALQEPVIVPPSSASTNQCQLGHYKKVIGCVSCELLWNHSEAALALRDYVQHQPECSWHLDDVGGDSVWETGCGQSFEFTVDGPFANGLKFCGYCGQRLIETRTSDEGSALLTSEGPDPAPTVRVDETSRCQDCHGPLIWDVRGQGWSCHFCSKLFEDRCNDLGATAHDVVKHALEDQARLKELLTREGPPA